MRDERTDVALTVETVFRRDSRRVFATLVRSIEQTGATHSPFVTHVHYRVRH